MIKAIVWYGESGVRSNNVQVCPIQEYQSPYYWLQQNLTEHVPVNRGIVDQFSLHKTNNYFIKFKPCHPHCNYRYSTVNTRV